MSEFTIMKNSCFNCFNPSLYPPANPKLLSNLTKLTLCLNDEIIFKELSVDPLSITTTSACLLECSMKSGRNCLSQFSPLKFNMQTAVLITRGL